MKIVKICQNNPDPEIIKMAAKILKSGGLVVYPTDTAYGLGVKAYDKYAELKRKYVSFLSQVLKEATK